MILTIIFLLLCYFIAKNKFTTDRRKHVLDALNNRRIFIRKSEVTRDRFTIKKIPVDLDAIVIGSGISGLTTAGLLTRFGKKVLVLEGHYIAGGCTHTFVDKGFEFDTGVHYVGNSKECREILDVITKEKVEWDQMGREDGNYVYDEICLENKKYPLRSGVDNWLGDMSKRFPKRKKVLIGYIDLVQKVSKMNIWFISKLFKSSYLTAFINYWFGGKFLRLARKSTYDALRELTDDEELIAVLCGQFGDYNLPPKRASFFLHCCIVDHYLEGGFYPRGGTSVIAKNIIPVIEEGGGRVLVSKKVEKILVENGKAVGVRMENGVEIRAEKIISAVGVNTTYRKLLDCDLSTSLVLNKIGFSKSFMHLFVGLDKGVEELGLRSVNIWDLPNKNYEDLINNFNKDQENSPMVSFISSPSAKDSTWKSRFPGKSTVTVIVPIKWEVFSKWDKNKNKDYLNKKEAIKTRMLETLYKHYPKTRGHVVYTSIGSPLTYNTYIGSNFGEVYGASSSKTRFRENDFLKPYTNIENLYLTGQDILSIGYTGAMMSGFLTANICLGYNVLKLAAGIDCVKDIKAAEKEYFS
jgi:all-trans-retinol 13,14-reductase